MTTEAQPPAEAKPHTQRFRRASRASALSPEQKRRQAIVTDAAWRRFGSAAPMIAFLNSADLPLGGRPLDVALGSDEGLDAVLAALEQCSPAGNASEGGSR